MIKTIYFHVLKFNSILNGFVAYICIKSALLIIIKSFKSLSDNMGESIEIDDLPDKLDNITLDYDKTDNDLIDFV